MYSRRFSEQPDLPPDYGGVAMRSGGFGTRESERDPQTEPFQKEQTESARTKERCGEKAERALCRPRRPLYERARSSKKERRAVDERDRTEQQSGQKGLLSSLFSLSGKSFTLEDVILAGLILLLLGEREKGEKVDGELIFALTFLLLGGK